MNRLKLPLVAFYTSAVIALSALASNLAYAQEDKIDPGALAAVVSFLLQDDIPPGPAPSVSFARLSNNQVLEFGQGVSVEAILADVLDPVLRVELLLNGERIRVESFAPYEWGNSASQDPELFELPVGQHTLTLRAIEQDGSSFSSQTITINLVDSAGLSQVSLAIGERIGFEKSQEPATFVLSRTGSQAPTNINYTLGAIGVAGGLTAMLEEQEYDLVYRDTGEQVSNTLFFAQGQSQRTIEVRPHVDSRFETAESLSITILESTTYDVVTPESQGITILDARNSAANEQTFVGIFRPVDGANTAATGVLSLVLRGDNRQARLSYSFRDLSSEQQDQFLDLAPGGSTFDDLPSGNAITDYFWDIVPNGFLTTSQDVLDALIQGNFFVRILSDDFPQGEISAFILRSDNDGGVEIPEEALTPEQVDVDIIRFLNQATFGATEESYNALRSQIVANGSNRRQVYEAWIDQQLTMPATNMSDLMRSISENEELGIATRFERPHTFWTLAINSPDQLRHRLAQSLSEILVISDDVNPILNAYLGITSYWDMLASSGTGTYKTLLGNVTRHTSMGTYLSHLQNQKANVEQGIFPDENYAREIMQLFSFGLVHLNQDGSLMLDANNAPIPTYNNAIISEMARVFTGLSVSRVADGDGDSENTNFSANDRNSSGNQAQWTNPMRFFPDYHDFGRKVLFVDQGSQVIINASGASIGAADQELDDVINAVVSHSSTAPRISRLLIQQLVTSNPSGAYVTRVADAFGEDGDMRATIKAILLDQEARNPNVVNVRSFGKQKSPLLQLTSFMRLTDSSSEFYLDGRNSDINFINANRFDDDASFLRVGAFSTEHQNLSAASVFNFYSSNYSPPGEFSNRSLVAPEMELLTETSLFDTLNDFFLFIRNGSLDAGTRADDYTVSRDQQTIRINRDRLTAVFKNAAGDDRAKASVLVDYLDFYYNASQLALTNDVSGTRDFIIDAVVNSSGEDRIELALYGVANAPESLVQK